MAADVGLVSPGTPAFTLPLRFYKIKDSESNRKNECTFLAWNQKVVCDVEKFRTTTGIFDSSSGGTVTNRHDYLIARVAGFVQTRLKFPLHLCVLTFLLAPNYSMPTLIHSLHRFQGPAVSNGCPPLFIYPEPLFWIFTPGLGGLFLYDLQNMLSVEYSFFHDFV